MLLINSYTPDFFQYILIYLNKISLINISHNLLHNKSRFQIVKDKDYLNKNKINKKQNRIMDNIKIVQLNGKKYVVNLNKRIQ